MLFDMGAQVKGRTMYYGYDTDTLKKFNKQKESLAYELSVKLKLPIGHPIDDGYNPYVSLDDPYAVTIRRITNLTSKKRRRLVQKADEILMKK